MKTLIELYDKRPIENVLSTEVFRPEKTVFVCPYETAGDTALKQHLCQYMRHRGIRTELQFIGVSLIDAGEVARTIEQIVKREPDCAIDIAGGTDAALFAAGMICAKNDIPVFTYSRRKNTFFSINNAGFAQNKACNIRYDIESCILMAGGSIERGRVDNTILHSYICDIEPFFDVYMANRSQWVNIVTYIQRISQDFLQYDARNTVAGSKVINKGGKTSVFNEEAMRRFEEIGFIQDLKVSEDTVSFAFKDEQIRTWMRDIGAVLELYTYKKCLDLHLFDEVKTSVIIRWNDSKSRDAVTNEIDVVVTEGVRPFFISCKTCDIKTESLNELAILRDRFGGEMSRAAIVTTENAHAPVRHRAMELGIDVIDLSDFQNDQFSSRLKALIRE